MLIYNNIFFVHDLTTFRHKSFKIIMLITQPYVNQYREGVLKIQPWTKIHNDWTFTLERKYYSKCKLGSVLSLKFLKRVSHTCMNSQKMYYKDV